MYQFKKIRRDFFEVSFRGIVIGRIQKWLGGWRPIIQGNLDRYGSREAAAKILKAHYKPVKAG